MILDSPNAFHLKYQNMLLLIEIFKKVLVFTNTISSAIIAECVLVMESHFKSFSTKITSKVQSANAFSSCFQKSTKNLISQNLIVHDVLRKRKISDDQIRKRLKNLGILDQLEKTQICFPSYFWQKRNWHQKKLWQWWKTIIVFQKK